MMNFDDINFGPKGPRPFDKHCPEPLHPHMLPPCDVDRRLYDFIVHVDGVAHKALEVAGSASLEATTARRLAEQSLKVINKVSAIANRADVKAGRALNDLSVLKDDFVRLLTELNKVEESAGLTKDGKYIKNTEAKYISEAVNLADADNKLDEAIKGVSESVETLEEKLDALQSKVEEFEEEFDQINAVQSNIIAAVGLKETGKYQKGTNSIINTAKSVLEADELLAEAIGELSETVEQLQDSSEDITELKEQVETNTSDIAELKSKDIELRRDIDKNTRNITANSANIESNTQAITEVNTRVSNVERRVDLLDSKIDPTHALAEQANQRVSIVEGRVDTLAGTVSTLQSNVSNNSSSITALEAKVDSIDLEELGEFEYGLVINGEIVGRINIAKDQLLSQVRYNQETKVITFIFENGATVDINISDLIDVYSGGNGIQISGSTVSAKIDPQSEQFLSVNTNGLRVSGIQAAIDKRYQAGKGLKRSLTPNAEGEYTFDVQIQENSRPYLTVDVDGLGININALKQELDFDPSALAGNHLTYNSVTNKLDVNVASLVSDPIFITAVTNIVEAALLWERKGDTQIQPKDGKSVYVNGTIDATGAIYSGQ